MTNSPRPFFLQQLRSEMLRVTNLTFPSGRHIPAFKWQKKNLSAAVQRKLHLGYGLQGLPVTTLCECWGEQSV